MADLQEHQFELGGVVFGIYADVTVEDGGFDTGTAGWRTQDTEAALDDALIFGEDRLTPPVWGFTMSTDKEDVEGALAAMAKLRKAWKADRTRRKPGAVEALRYRVGGRTRRVYGRPRRWSAPPDNMILGGYVPITADFQRADDLHYEDNLQSITVGLVEKTTGGWVFPLTFPLGTMASSGSRAGQFTVAGDEPTWGVLRFNGPGGNFRVYIDGKYYAGLDGNLAWDRSVTIDPRPWARTVTRNDGAGMSEMLTRRTFMQNMLLNPGAHEITIEGEDATNTGSVTLEWRGASSSL